MSIKTTERFHLSPVRKTIIEKKTITSREDAGIQNPCILLVGMEIGMETLFLKKKKKLKLDLPLDPRYDSSI